MISRIYNRTTCRMSNEMTTRCTTARIRCYLVLLVNAVGWLLLFPDSAAARIGIERRLHIGCNGFVGGSRESRR